MTYVLIVALVLIATAVVWLYRRWRARPTTTLTVASRAGFAKGDTISANGEYYVITKIDGQTFTVRRR